MRSDEHIHIRGWAVVADTAVDRIDSVEADIVTGMTDRAVVVIGILHLVAVVLIVGHRVTAAVAVEPATVVVGMAEATQLV